MTREETKNVIAMMVTAYPYFGKKSGRELALTVDLWASAFINVPYQIVVLAVKKLIATNTFAPTIAEVTKKIERIRSEAMEELMTRELTCAQAEELKRIVDGCRQMSSEPSLFSLIEERRPCLEAHDEP